MAGRRLESRCQGSLCDFCHNLIDSKEKTMIKGSCLCGGVQYEYDGELRELVICHCNMCKRAQGTPFATNSPINSDLFRIVTGDDLLKSYYSSEKKKRVFCADCGSPIFSQKTDMPEVLRLRVGTVTCGKIPQPGYQQHCESRSNWFVLRDDLPSYIRKKT